MKTLVFLLALGLLTGLGLVQAFAQNTVLGLGAGSGGNYNTHIGYVSGMASTASFNVFMGGFSGYSNSTGNNNTFLGYGSGASNSTGYSNTFLGFGSGQYSTSGYRNTFLGSYSGNSNSTGINNTFIGFNSGYKNTNGNNNTFVGLYSGWQNTTGSSNTFLGNYSGKHTTNGGKNVFLGTSSGQFNTSGVNNTFLGYFSGYRNQIGAGNVFIGYNAGYSETGSNKLYVDNSSDSNPLLYGNFSTNVLSIGTKYTGTTYKLVVPGKIRATEYWIVGSPDRRSSRISSSSKGLSDVLMKVKKVESIRYMQEHTTQPADSVNTAKTTANKEPKETYGFVSETVKEVFPELVMEEEGELAINYQGMIPVLVEAIKELSLQKDSIIQTLLKENIQMKQELSTMKQALQQRGILSNDGESGNLLEQNRPNPFNQGTTINYQVSSQAEQVSLLITNLQGIQVQRLNNLQPGQGEVEVTGNGLPAGTYIYTLVVDGKPVSSQKMILTR